MGVTALEICRMRAAGVHQKAAEATVKRNHSMPQCAAMLAKAREDFGDDTEMTWADEGVKKWGNLDWWKRNGLHDHQPDNRTINLTQIELGGCAK